MPLDVFALTDYGIKTGHAHGALGASPEAV